MWGGGCRKGSLSLEGFQQRTWVRTLYERTREGKVMEKLSTISKTPA